MYPIWFVKRGHDQIGNIIETSSMLPTTGLVTPYKPA